MDKKHTGKGETPTVESLKDKAIEAVGKGGDRNLWIRDDGAVCIGNDCISFISKAGQPMELAVDPDKCPCESNEAKDALLDNLASAVINGKGITLTIKPRTT